VRRRLRIRRGLDVRVPGAPEQRIVDGPPVRHVALVGDDYAGLRPRLAVRPGDRVRAGELLFTDRRNEGVRFVAPGAGEVVAIHRGPRRRLVSVVIRLEGDDAEEFRPFDERALADPGDAETRHVLVASGLWTALRARPFGRVAQPGGAADAIFVQALDTEPLAPDPALVLAGRAADLDFGLRVLRRLTAGPLWLCVRPGGAWPDVEGVSVCEVAGPHPAGLPGTHIHHLAPVGGARTAWHAGAQDVAAIGALFRTGRLPLERVVAVAGPQVDGPCLLRTRAGASTDELLAGRLRPGAARVLSGSPLSGRAAEGPAAFLGRYARAVCALPPAPPGWPGPARAIYPLDAYERVFPFDLPPVPLLKALAVGDVDRARELGCLELAEEDLALCAYVDPGRNAFGPSLRAALATLEAER